MRFPLNFLALSLPCGNGRSQMLDPRECHKKRMFGATFGSLSQRNWERLVSNAPSRQNRQGFHTNTHPIDTPNGVDFALLRQFVFVEQRE